MHSARGCCQDVYALFSVAICIHVNAFFMHLFITTACMVSHRHNIMHVLRLHSFLCMNEPMDIYPCVPLIQVVFYDDYVLDA